ncbi:MAG: hypothetical protein HOY71_16560 [Nonomuraea sp.]|nr:hypothetical protein [Nonomuraea sp.]
MHTLVKGLIAGAAGTTALNTASYLDMAIRARGASSTPQQAVDKLAGITHTDLGDGERADHRKEALGSLMGYATGVASAIAYGMLSGRRRRPWPLGVLALTGLAMSGSNVPLTLLGATDPRTWSAGSWVSDVIPHLAYGFTAYAAYEMMR